MQSNAYIKFTEKDWGHWIKFHSQSTEGGIRLVINTFKLVAHINKYNSINDAIKEKGLESEFKALEVDYNNYISKHTGFKASKFYEEVVKNKGFFIINYYSYLTLTNVDDFYSEISIKRISLVITEMYTFSVRLQGLYDRILIANK